MLHRASLADETPEGFERSWRVNCLGPFWVCEPRSTRSNRPTARDRQYLQHGCRAGFP